jgi:uncharacterized protein YndB with AHSA1/START domain
MPAPLHAAGPDGFTIDRDSHTIRFERLLAAAPAQVFTAWTTPEHVARWWDPDGDPLVICDIDLRPGGAFAFATRNHVDRPFGGIYSEVTPPNRLIFDAMGSTGRVLLSDAPGGTRMTVEIACQSAEHLDQFIEMGVHLGTARTLDNLVAHMAEESAAA